MKRAARSLAPLALLLSLCALGCQPIAAGDRAAHPLLGEWEVARTEEGASGGLSYRPFIFAFQADDAAWVFANETRPGSYALEGERLTLRLKGYRPERFTVLRREGGFDLRHEPSGATYYLVSRQRFDLLGLLIPCLVGLAGAALLVAQGRPLRVLLDARAWPEVPAEVLSASVEKRKAPRDSQGKRTGSKTFVPKLRFRYEVEGRWREGHNEAPYNRWAIYTRSQAEAQVARWKREGLSVRYDPHDPSRVFLGRRHFPLATTLFCWLLGSLLALGLSAAASDAAGWAGYRVLKVGSVDWPVLAVFAALPLYLLLSQLGARLLPQGSPPAATEASA